MQFLKIYSFKQYQFKSLTSFDLQVYSPITLAIVTYFMVELGFRMFVWGYAYFISFIFILLKVFILK